jgi:tetratricopeptide (TPR) repeat protein
METHDWADRMNLSENPEELRRLAAEARREGRMEVAGWMELEAAERQLSRTDPEAVRPFLAQARKDAASCNALALTYAVDIIEAAVLHSEGKLRQALASLEETGAAIDASRPDLGKEAEALLAAWGHHKGLVEDDLGNHEVAAILHKGAIDRHLAAGNPGAAARAEVGLASALFQGGRAQEAVAVLSDAASRMEKENNPDLALVWGNLGIILLALGSLDEGVELIKKALEESTSRGLDDQSIRWKMNLAVAASSSDDFETASALFGEARRQAVKLGRRIEAACCTYNLAWTAMRLNEHGAAIEYARSAATSFETLGMTSEQAAISMLYGWISALQGDDTEAERSFQAALCAFEKTGKLLEAAICRHGLALLWRRRGDDAKALELALASLSVIDAYRYQLARSPLRASWSRRHSALYALTFELAADSNDPTLLAELIESARIQAVPSFPGNHKDMEALGLALLQAEVFQPPAEQPLRASGAKVDEVLGLIGEVPIAAQPAILVGGYSRLASASDAPRRAVSLEKAAGILGGSQSWWWGTWEAAGSLYYSLISPEGEVSAGSIPFGEGSRLQKALSAYESALDTALQLSPKTGGVSGGNARDLPFSFMEELGSALLPPPLVKRLQSGGEDPLDLLIAPAPRLARVAFSLLEVEGVLSPEGNGHPAALVEMATPRLACSSAFAVALGERELLDTAGGRRPVLLAVLDPLGDLAYARRVPPGAKRVLGGSAVLAAGHVVKEMELARREDLIVALYDVKEAGKRDGLLVYKGHVHSAPATSTGAALVLADGELSARDLFLMSPDGPGLLVPERVLLAACESAGRPETYGGEWMSLAPAMLWAGAESVLATCWALPDMAETDSLDSELVELVRRPGDVAKMLSYFQRRHLSSWRKRGGRPGEPGPLWWAAYVAIERYGSDGKANDRSCDSAGLG